MSWVFGNPWQRAAQTTRPHEGDEPFYLRGGIIPGDSALAVIGEDETVVHLPVMSGWW